MLAEVVTKCKEKATARLAAVLLSYSQTTPRNHTKYDMPFTRLWQFDIAY
jgi:hypothetical protein